MKRLLTVLFLPLSLALAADGPRKPDPFAGLLVAPDQVMKARSKLGLTDAQQKQLRVIYDANRPDYDAKAAAIAPAQQALRAALEKQPLDESEAAALFTALLTRFAEIGERLVQSPEGVQWRSSSAERHTMRLVMRTTGSVRPPGMGAS